LGRSQSEGISGGDGCRFSAAQHGFGLSAGRGHGREHGADLAYEAVPGFFQTPPGDTMGELQGVATNSKGNIFAFFAGHGPGCGSSPPTANSSRKSARAFTAFLFAHSVRVDRHDNIWTVDEGTNVITKFNPMAPRY